MRLGSRERNDTVDVLVSTYPTWLKTVCSGQVEFPCFKAHQTNGIPSMSLDNVLRDGCISPRSCRVGYQLVVIYYSEKLG